jgi:dTDP-4-dehydrorhamnose 3,5-epimerase
MGEHMEYRRFDLAGPVEITPRKIGDYRGYFSEVFRADAFNVEIGHTDFLQENQSFSQQSGTLRGLHFQIAPFAQGKLVRCIAGSIFDVAVDLRTGSPSYGRWITAELTAEAGNQLWVPPGFGHGFCTLEPDTVVSYKVSAYYSQECDKGVAWDDPAIAVQWPTIADPGTLSAKDRVQPALVDLPSYFQF